MRLSLAAVVLLSLVAPSRAADPDAPVKVAYRNDRLTVHATNASLPDVLDAIAHTTGAELHGEPVETPPRDIDVDNLPMQDAMTRILGDQSFTLTYGEGGALKRIGLRGGPTAKQLRTDAPDATQGSLNAKAATAAKTIDDLIHSGRRYKVPKRLGDKLGSDEVTFEEIAATGVKSDDAGVRGEAQRASMRLIEAEPEIRNAFVDLLSNVDDAQAAIYLRAIMQDNAREFMGTVAEYAQTPALRTRGQTLQRTLQ